MKRFFQTVFILLAVAIIGYVGLIVSRGGPQILCQLRSKLYPLPKVKCEITVSETGKETVKRVNTADDGYGLYRFMFEAGGHDMVVEMLTPHEYTILEGSFVLTPAPSGYALSGTLKADGYSTQRYISTIVYNEEGTSRIYGSVMVNGEIRASMDESFAENEKLVIRASVLGN